MNFSKLADGDAQNIVGGAKQTYYVLFDSQEDGIKKYMPDSSYGGQDTSFGNNAVEDDASKTKDVFYPTYDFGDGDGEQYVDGYRHGGESEVMQVNKRGAV
jgi:hypothetical protein